MREFLERILQVTRITDRILQRNGSLVKLDTIGEIINIKSMYRQRLNLLVDILVQDVKRCIIADDAIIFQIIGKVEHDPVALVPAALGILHVGNLDAIVNSPSSVDVLSKGAVTQILSPQNRSSGPNTYQRIADDVIGG